MYLEFYGLTEKPFSLTPNPRYVYYSRQYREAETQLLFGIKNHEGFMLVTGEPGTGKTTLCRNLIDKLDRKNVATALLFNPFLSGNEMLAALLTDFGITPPLDGSRKELLDALNLFLLKQLTDGKRSVMIFDEAQHLSTELLEQMRVLSNLETHNEKLIQIVLVGQPELLEKLHAPNMAQLDQRVSIRCMLKYLDEEETDRYIQHRLNVAGSRGENWFSRNAIREICRASAGVPRTINLICDRALLAGYTTQAREIRAEHAKTALRSLRGEPDTGVTAARGRPRWFRSMIAAAAVLVAGIIGTGGFALYTRQAAAAEIRSADEVFGAAAMAANASDAERSWQRFITAFPTSSRVGEAYRRLAAAQMAMGQRDAALRTIEQLVERSPDPGTRTLASVWTSRIRLDAGDTTAACQALAARDSGADLADPLLSLTARDLGTICASHIASASPQTHPSAPSKLLAHEGR